MTPSITTTTVTTWQEFAAAWEQLDLSRSAETFFQELNIQKSWWESMGSPELSVVIVAEDRKPIAIFPFCRVENQLQLLGDKDVSDYLDVSITVGKEKIAWDELGRVLRQDHSWQRLFFVSLPEQSPSFNYLKDLTTTYSWQYSQVQQDVCPIIQLPPTWEEYLSVIGKKQRHEITRKWKRLAESAQLNFRVVTSTVADPDSLTDFLRLHRQSSLEKAAFWTDEHTKYFELLSTAASEAGWLRLYFLDVNNEPAAAMYCFDYQDSLLIYNSGFNAEKFLGMSIGNVLTSYTIQDAITLGKKKYDFLRGGEEYKFRYRAEPKPVMDVLIQRASDS